MPVRLKDSCDSDRRCPNGWFAGRWCPAGWSSQKRPAESCDMQKTWDVEGLTMTDGKGPWRLGRPPALEIDISREKRPHSFGSPASLNAGPGPCKSCREARRVSGTRFDRVSDCWKHSTSFDSTGRNVATSALRMPIASHLHHLRTHRALGEWGE